MIAFELNFIKNKDPEYDPLDLTHKSITKHTKFMTGFMFTCLKDKDDKEIISSFQANTHPHLAKILGKNSHVRGEAQLSEFVRILLSLKHPKVLPLFVDAYEAIIAAFEGIAFTDLKSEHKRFTVIDRIN
jgi:hypothetical protein